jgi:membrane protease YdiL (CAAX protease family)
MIIFLSIVFTITVLFFTLIFLVNWYRKRELVTAYKKYGYWAGGVLILLEILLLLLNPDLTKSISFGSIVFSDILAFIRISAFTIVGIYYCNLLDLPSLPILMNTFGLSESETHSTIQLQHVSIPFEENEINTGLVDEITDENDIKIEKVAEHVPHHIPVRDYNLKNYFTSVIIVAIGAVLFSSILFYITSPRASDLVRQAMGLNTANASYFYKPSLFAVVIMLEFALAEEVVFRLGIQNFIASKFSWQGSEYWNAILLSSFLWTLGHVGVIEPDWVKLLQIFPIGLALGWLSKKYGTESSILAHGLFNVIMLFLAQYLIAH